ncbi:MFS transporter [Microvirga pudoricolor]|uniref:MFS transporter n=1 Tax=Microvirga pudoricolor TaxID=2778729 RepID=UPI0019521D86|nr:hypothetical protein [Microvirga pudoricolor]MBM6595165.1 hypothetical protein [Microvirga pudoricolor]
MVASGREIGLLYAAAVAQGLALVTFPAASAVFTDPNGFAFSSTQYGTMFLPQFVMAILASSLAPKLAARRGLKAVLLVGLVADLASMAVLAASALMTGTAIAFPIICLATAALGFGFGATVTALNSLSEAFFPERPDRAVLTVNALLGVGTALAPLFVAVLSGLGLWWALPVLMVLCLGLILVLLVRQPLQAGVPGETRSTSQTKEHLPGRFWLYGGAVLLYGILETISGNWGTLYLSQERGVPVHEASYALTAFWVAVTLGRVIVAGLASHVSPRVIYQALPVLLALAFGAAASAHSGWSGILAFGLLGLACSALLPLSLSFAGSEFPRLTATTAGGLLALYQIGYGIAAFGVGPLQEMAGVSLGRIFQAGIVIAIALTVAAFLIARRNSSARA